MYEMKISCVKMFQFHMFFIFEMKCEIFVKNIPKERKQHLYCVNNFLESAFCLVKLSCLNEFQSGPEKLR